MEPTCRADPAAAAAVHLWDLSGAILTQETWLGPDVLSRGERERAAGLRPGEHRQRFVMAHALMRVSVADALGEGPACVRIDQTCPRCGRPHGKPRLVDHPDHDLSLAHAGALVAVLLVRGRGGVDIERAGRVAATPSIVRVAFTAREQEAIAQHGHDPELAVWFWTAKEAAAKAYGVHTPLLSTDFADTALALQQPLRPRRWREGWSVTAFIPAAGYVGAAVTDVEAVSVRPVQSAARLLRGYCGAR